MKSAWKVKYITLNKGYQHLSSNLQKHNIDQ